MSSSGSPSRASRFESRSATVSPASVEAVTRVPAEATAYPHRQPGFNLIRVSQWTEPAQTDACIAWARQTFDALAPYMAERSYTSYLSADDYYRVRQAFGPNYERLVEVKRRCDPENRFRGNQDIDPKAMTS